MRITFKHLIVTIAALLAGAVLAGRAAAMSPAQSNAYYLANAIQFNQQTGATPYGSIEHFWSTTLRSWGVGYVRPRLIWYGDYFGVQSTKCVDRWGRYDTVNMRQNGFYCPPDETVFLDYEYMNSLIAWYGDFGAGGFMAHEWGHRIQHVLGRRGTQTFQGEYHADCLAGMYTRWGYMTGLLSGGDYWEFSNWLSNNASSDSHGSGGNRAAWFKYGYTQYSLGACDSAYRLTVAYAHTKGKKASLKPPPTKRKLDLRPRNVGLPTGPTGLPVAQSGSPAAASGQATSGFDSLLSVF